MSSIGSVLNIAKEALLTHQASIAVAGHNIANVDTPNYKALDISFRDQLECLLETRRRGDTGMRSVSHSPPPPTLVQSPDLYSLWPRIDRNTVNIDKELARLSQNTILHNTYLQLLKSKFGTLKDVIRESSR